MINFQKDDYKELLRESLLDRKENAARDYSFQKMAQACRVQKTYLSRVFNGEAHLNHDQVYLACEFLGMSDDERSFVSLLHERERSVVPRKKQEIEAQIVSLRERYSRTEGHLKIDAVAPTNEDFSRYYLEPEMQLAHLFLTIERYQKAPIKIADALGITVEKTKHILLALERLGLICIEDGRYKILKDQLHLSKNSTLQKACASLLRLRSLQKIAASGDEEGSYHFAVVFSANEEVRKRIQAKFFEFLKSIKEDVENAPCEDVYQINFDLLPWSR